LNPPAPPAPGQLGDGRVAVAVDRPGSPEALQEAIARRVAEGHALYPQGGRTALDYGGTPRLPGVAIDTTALDQIIDYPAADMTITVQAGVTLSTLRAVLAEHHQRLPLDAPDPDRATLGGIFACNASGPRRFGAGRPRDMILGVTFATSDGNLVKGGGRVVKNVAGYDLPKLLTGSLGTLGIIAQMTLKVRPAPQAAAIVLLPFDSVSELGEALTRLNTSGTRPMALEILNKPAVTRLSPELSEHPWLMAVGFEDNADSVAWQVGRLREEIRPSHPPTVLEGADAEPLWASLAEFQALAEGPLSIVVGLPISQVVPVVSGLDPSNWMVQVHAGNGIIRAHATDAMSHEVLLAEVPRLRALAASLGGHLILPRCPTDWKERLRVWGEPRADWAIADKVKRALDPKGVMNPGRFVVTI